MWSSIKIMGKTLVLFTLLIFTACTGPGVQAPRGSATVTLGMRGLDLGLLLEGQPGVFSPGQSLKTQSIQTDGRLLHHVSRLELTLFTDKGEIADTLEIQNGPELMGGTFSGNLTGDPGVGYTVKAEIFSSYHSSTVSVVSGLSSPFSIQAGQTTGVSLTCFPTNPEVLSPGAPPYFMDLTPGFIEDFLMLTTGEERWFKFQGDGTTMTLLAEIDDLSRLGIVVQVFDDQGEELTMFSPLNNRGSQQVRNEIQVPTTADQTYYVLAYSLNFDISFNGMNYIAGPFSLSLTADLVEAASLEDTNGPVELTSRGLNTYEAFVPWNVATATFRLTPKDPTSTFSSLGKADSDGVFSVNLAGRTTQQTFYVTSPEGKTDSVSLTVHKLQPLVPGSISEVEVEGQIPSFGILPVNEETSYRFVWDDAGEGSGTYTADVYVSVLAEDMSMLNSLFLMDDGFSQNPTFTTPLGTKNLIVCFEKKGNSSVKGSVGFKAELIP